jgi:DNA-binding GntR family transcriptional regulator
MARTSAQQRVYDTVKRDLVEGVIRPGERIVDAELCARLHVSRTPVREALLALEREGLIRIVPRQGYFASEISLREALDAYQLRLILEPIATAMAAQHISTDELHELRGLADVVMDGSDDGFARAVEMNAAFHIRVAAASGNHRLARIMADLMADLKRLAYVELRTAQTAVSWREEHLEIVEALAERDPARAAQVVRASFQRDDGLLPLRARSDLAILIEEVSRETEPAAQRGR